MEVLTLSAVNFIEKTFA